MRRLGVPCAPMCFHVLTFACNLDNIFLSFTYAFTVLLGYLRRNLPHVNPRLFSVLICCQICANHTHCLNLSRFRALIFNSFTNQRELAEPLLFPYLSCTYKATTPPRRALIHLQPIKLPQTTQKPQKRRAQCHHLVSRAMVFKR